MNICCTYFITSTENEKVFVGSIDGDLQKKLLQLKAKHKKYKNGIGKYSKVFEILKDGDCEIIPVEQFNNITKKELKEKEKDLIMEMNERGDECIN